jgi:2,4-dienoyl-CoA reductase-like NADH-dependent reductase (Old Yellow Enzyme family)
MNGPEHYQEAERLIEMSQDARREDAPHVLAIAQVHATLALSAATALSRYTADMVAWDRVAGADPTWVEREGHKRHELADRHRQADL